MRLGPQRCHALRKICTTSPLLPWAPGCLFPARTRTPPGGFGDGTLAMVDPPRLDGHSQLDVVGSYWRTCPVLCPSHPVGPPSFGNPELQAPGSAPCAQKAVGPSGRHTAQSSPNIRDSCSESTANFCFPNSGKVQNIL
ncbi:hypothetical protein MG293_013049 [Ovis ammon polii]|uniref:Uncharacterized protein n=1 Tax=Ovis ammon polii TaxID=230172 RepID=A0AAD4Y808_OVIAM|nr:hypothetical protein MG293_013049 [Ovis ammon polii]